MTPLSVNGPGRSLFGEGFGVGRSGDSVPRDPGYGWTRASRRHHRTRRTSAGTSRSLRRRRRTPSHPRSSLSLSLPDTMVKCLPFQFSSPPVSTDTWVRRVEVRLEEGCQGDERTPVGESPRCLSPQKGNRSRRDYPDGMCLVGPSRTPPSPGHRRTVHTFSGSDVLADVEPSSHGRLGTTPRAPGSRRPPGRTLSPRRSPGARGLSLRLGKRDSGSGGPPLLWSREWTSWGRYGPGRSRGTSEWCGSASAGLRRRTTRSTTKSRRSTPLHSLCPTWRKKTAGSAVREDRGPWSGQGPTRRGRRRCGRLGGG